MTFGAVGAVLLLTVGGFVAFVFGHGADPNPPEAIGVMRTESGSVAVYNCAGGGVGEVTLRVLDPPGTAPWVVRLKRGERPADSVDIAHGAPSYVVDGDSTDQESIVLENLANADGVAVLDWQIEFDGRDLQPGVVQLRDGRRLPTQLIEDRYPNCGLPG